MAVTMLGNTKSSTNSLNYAKKRADVKSGLNCDVEMATEQLKATRELWSKIHSDKSHIHNHIVINSVNFENGKKYQSNIDKLKEIKMIKDKLCKENGLSMISDHSYPSDIHKTKKQF